MAQYQDIAEDLRRRIAAGEWEIGDRLPGISDLQEHYNARSLGTIRSAQALLVTDGMLRTEQGVGVFVTALRPARSIDVAAELVAARDHLNEALAGVQNRKGHVTFYLLGDDSRHFVLEDALREWAWRQRSQAEDEASNEDPDDTGQQRLEWAETAEEMLAEIEAAMS